MIAANQDLGYVVFAYLGAFAVTCGVIAYVVLDARRQNKRLADLQARGIGRRSSGGKNK
jgi:heme exporter protein D